MHTFETTLVYGTLAYGLVNMLMLTWTITESYSCNNALGIVNTFFNQRFVWVHLVQRFRWGQWSVVDFCIVPVDCFNQCWTFTSKGLVTFDPSPPSCFQLKYGKIKRGYIRTCRTSRSCGEQSGKPWWTNTQGRPLRAAYRSYSESSLNAVYVEADWQLSKATVISSTAWVCERKRLGAT